MNKKILIVVVIFVAVVGLSYFIKTMVATTPNTDDQTSTTTAMGAPGAASDKPDGSAPVVKAPGVQPPASMTGLQQAFVGQGSYRCEWNDKNTGADAIALIKDGNVRVESKATDGVQTNIVYTSIGTYIWKEGEKTGIAIPKEASASGQATAFQSRSQIETQLVNNTRVTCQESALSESHFSLPTDVKFQVIKA